MPVLPNQRHEAFAQALAKGKTADEAYALAGFKPNRGNAATLKAKQSILDRVEPYQGPILLGLELFAEVDGGWPNTSKSQLPGSLLSSELNSSLV